MNFCCKEMNLFIADPRNSIQYNQIFREHYIKIPGRSIIITFSYCPWCGVKLPKKLRSEFFDTLEEEYNIETNIGEYKSANLPEEYRSDEWWRKRGL